MAVPEDVNVYPIFVPAEKVSRIILVMGSQVNDAKKSTTRGAETVAGLVQVKTLVKVSIPSHALE